MDSMNKIYTSSHLSPNRTQPDAEEVQPSDSIDDHNQVAYTNASESLFPIVHADRTSAAWMKSPPDNGPEILPGFNVSAPNTPLNQRTPQAQLNTATRFKPRQPNSPRVTFCGSTFHKLEAQVMVEPEWSTGAPRTEELFKRSDEAWGLDEDDWDPYVCCSPSWNEVQASHGLLEKGSDYVDFSPISVSDIVTLNVPSPTSSLLGKRRWGADVGLKSEGNNEDRPGERVSRKRRI